MNKILHYKFSDLVRGTGRFELFVGDSKGNILNKKLINPSRADFFFFALVLKGQIVLKIAENEKTITKNSIVFLTPNTLKQLRNLSSNVEFFSVIFTSKFLLHTGLEQREIEMIDFISRSNQKIIKISKDEADILKKTIIDLKQKGDRILEHPFGENIVQYSFRIFFSEIAAIAVKYKVVEKPLNGRKQDLVMRFANLVEKHFKEHREVKYYAKLLSISPKYLTETVHEVTGTSASVIIDEKVVQEIEHLLLNPRLTILQISDTLNFANQSFFGKYFKRHNGVSPSEYRQNNSMSVI